MHTPDAAQQILSEIANRNLKNVKFWCMDEGALPPVTPVNLYLVGNVQKKNEPLFTCLFIYTHFESLSLELNRVPGSLLEPYISQGGSGCRRDTYCIERVKEIWVVFKWFWQCLCQLTNYWHIQLCTNRNLTDLCTVKHNLFPRALCYSVKNPTWW